MTSTDYAIDRILAPAPLPALQGQYRRPTHGYSLTDFQPDVPRSDPAGRLRRR